MRFLSTRLRGSLLFDFLFLRIFKSGFILNGGCHGVGWMRSELIHTIKNQFASSTEVLQKHCDVMWWVVLTALMLRCI
jgi:phosphoenolpyruvate-protein kinase (PTS system EI component)